jgi:pimeloyl-ACP methyl ester carboxylesterase
MSFGDDVAGFDHATVNVNGTALHVVVGGKGPLVVLLHGWPESWMTWRHVMKPLKDAGFTVAAPDLRGFGDSEKPRNVADYELDKVALDVVGLVRALGFERAHIIGHDWGGSTAWHLAQHHDEIIDKLVVMNAPHPAIFAKRLRSFDQIKRAYYMFVFQVPVVAERLVSANDFKPLRNIMKYQPAKPGAFDDEDIKLYLEQMKKPGALTAGLNYYRAQARMLARGRVPKPKKPVIDRPTLVLWGMSDQVLVPANLDGIERYISDLRLVKIDQCSHWVQHDAPEVIVKESLAHFASSSSSSKAAAAA